LWQVLDWVSLVLDSHFTELLLLPLLGGSATGGSGNTSAAAASAHECRALLSGLHRAVSRQHVPLCDQIQGFRGFLAHFLRQMQARSAAAAAAAAAGGGAGAGAGAAASKAPATQDYIVQVLAL
jgi:hypothetical protein